MKTKILTGVLFILMTTICFVIAYSETSSIDYNGYYYKYEDGTDKLIKISGKVGKLYNIDPNGELQEVLMNVDITDDDEVCLYTSLESYFFILAGKELRSIDSDIIYKKINTEEFNKYLEESN